MGKGVSVYLLFGVWGLTLLIVDGKINKDILSYAKISEQWLVSQLQLMYKSNPEDVFMQKLTPINNYSPIYIRNFLQKL